MVRLVSRFLNFWVLEKSDVMKVSRKVSPPAVTRSAVICISSSRISISIGSKMKFVMA